MLYNVVMYQIELAMARSGGKAVVYDVSQLPTNLGMDMQTVLYHLNYEWNPMWGGPTVVNGVSYDYKPNRALIYKSNLLHGGKAGTGKTTLAKIITSNIDCDYMYINASDENKVDDVRNKIKTFASSVGFKSLKVIILDECDYLTPNAQAALRNLMETFSKHCRFILTCNYVERIIDPIQSRCQSYKVVPPSKKEVAQQMVNILKEENCTFELDDIALIVNAGYPDIRRVINSAQRQIVDGKLKIDTSSVIPVSYTHLTLPTSDLV